MTHLNMAEERTAGGTTPLRPLRAGWLLVVLVLLELVVMGSLGCRYIDLVRPTAGLPGSWSEQGSHARDVALEDIPPLGALAGLHSSSSVQRQSL